MELTSLAPLIVAVVVGLVLLRIVVGALKASAKLMIWAVVAAAMVGLGYVWFAAA